MIPMKDVFFFVAQWFPLSFCLKNEHHLYTHWNMSLIPRNWSWVAWVVSRWPKRSWWLFDVLKTPATKTNTWSLERLGPKKKPIPWRLPGTNPTVQQKQQKTNTHQPNQIPRNYITGNKKTTPKNHRPNPPNVATQLDPQLAPPPLNAEEVSYSPETKTKRNRNRNATETTTKRNATTPTRNESRPRQALEEAYRIFYDEAAQAGLSDLNELPEPPTSEV